MSKARTIEILLDGAAGAWMAACVGAALVMAVPALGAMNPYPVASVLAAAAAVVAYRILAALRGPQYRLPAFGLLPIDAVEPEPTIELSDELLLTPAMALQQPLGELLLTPEMAVLRNELLLTRGQMLVPPVEQSAEPLLLDDVLAELRPDSRVVQLFDPERMPTAGELKSRIDRHLSRAGGELPTAQQADASQALYDALADLRRSLA